MTNLTDLLGSGISIISDLSNVTVSASDPAVDTNPTAVGGLWLNKTSGEMFTCTDATAGENVWTNVGDGADAVEPPKWYGGRGLFAGGLILTAPWESNVIDYIAISTIGNATDFGNLSAVLYHNAGLAGGGRGVFGGGDPSYRSQIDYITISTTGNASNFGSLTVGRRALGACSDASRGLFAGGSTNGGGDCGAGTDYRNIIDYITIASTGSATDFGNLSYCKEEPAGCSNGSRGIFGGGYNAGRRSEIDYITISTTGNASNFGSLTAGTNKGASCDNIVRGVFMGGQKNTGWSIDIEYITIASTGNATDFGDLVYRRGWGAACSDAVKGVLGGGDEGSYYNYIDYITIASTGNATDFGDLTVARSRLAACSGD